MTFVRGMLLVSVLLSGSALHAGSADPGWRELQDMTGRTVRLSAFPSNVLSLCTSATDAIIALKASARLAAIEEYGRVMPGAEKISVIGKGSALSREEVLARRIDLAFIWWYQDDADRQLRQAGVPVVRLRSGRAAEVPGMLRLVGECMGCVEEAERAAAEIEDFLRHPQPPQSIRPKVYLELYGPFKTSGEGTYVNDLISLAGGTNVAAGASGNVVLSQECLIAANPEVLLFADQRIDAADFGRRGGLSGLDAVRRGRVWPVDRYLLVAGPNMPRAVERLRELLLRPGETGR